LPQSDKHENTGQNEQVRTSLDLSTLLKLAFRKLIYRKVLLGRYEIRASAALPPLSRIQFKINFLTTPAYHAILGTTPYLTQSDIDHFDRQESVCIVAYDGTTVAASSWMTSGEVHVTELHRQIQVPPGEHFFCRSYVRDDYRGCDLFSHLLYAYCRQLPPSDLVWGLIYNWNTASIRSVERLGCVHTGDYWVRFVFGIKIPGKRHFSQKKTRDTARDIP
jgi:hypothetical protein